MVCPGYGYEEEDEDFYPEPDDSLDDDIIKEDEDEEIEVDDDDEDYLEQEPILSTYNPADVAAIKAVLEDADISYHFEGDIPTTSNTYLEPARLFVNHDQIEEARELIDDLELSYMSLSPDEDPLEYDDFEGEEFEGN
jgi:hypothetical protein